MNLPTLGIRETLRAVAVLLCVALVAFVGFRVYRYSGELHRSQAALQAAQSRVAGLELAVSGLKKIKHIELQVEAGHAKAVKSILSKDKVTRAKVEAAIQASPAWADTPVPVDIIKSLEEADD